jgi:hypothetical protein
MTVAFRQGVGSYLNEGGQQIAWAKYRGQYPLWAVILQQQSGWGFSAAALLDSVRGFDAEV